MKSYRFSPASPVLSKIYAITLLALLLPGISFSQQGRVHAREAYIEESGAPLRFTSIVDNNIDSRQIILRTQDSVEPNITIEADVAADNIFELLNGTGDTMVQIGWFSGASEFGKILLTSTLDPEDVTAISSGGLETRTIVLRNTAGFTAAIHLEETGGGTDTVQIQGPAATAGWAYKWPGTDGSAGQCLSTNGSGTGSWAGCAGGTASAAGAIGDVNFSNDGVGTFGADAAFNWNNTDKRLKLGSSPPTTGRLNIDGTLAMDNSDFIGWEDGGGAVRQVLMSSGGQVILGHTVAPSAGGDTIITSFTGTTEVAFKLEARGDNVAVWQPQLIADGASTDAYYLGDNNNPLTALISLGVNLVGFGGSPAQLLIEEQGSTAGAGSFVTILGGKNTMAASYVIGLPPDTPAVGEFLKIASLDGSVYNSEWATGGAGTGCVPAGAAGEIQFSDGAGACLDDPDLFWDNTNKRLGVGTTAPSASVHIAESATPAQLWFRTDWNSAAAYSRIFSRTYPGAGNTSRGLILGGVAYGGTLASPTATLANSALFEFQGGGYDGTSERTDQGSMIIETPATWSGSSAPSQIRWKTTPVGSLSPADTMLLDGDGDLVLNNEHGYWIEDTSGNAMRSLWLDGSNTLNVGFDNQTVASGGDLSLWATGTVGGGQIGVQLNWTGSQAGTFAPISGDSIALGTAALPWQTASIAQQLVIDTNLIPAHVSMEDENASGRYFVQYGPPGTMAATYNVRWPAATPAASQFLQATALSGGAWNLSWVTSAPGAFTCNTANNCFNLTDIQTVTGAKTFNNSVLFNSFSTFGGTTTFNGSVTSTTFFNVAQLVLTGSATFLTDNAYNIGTASTQAANIYSRNFIAGESGSAGTVGFFSPTAGVSTILTGVNVSGTGGVAVGGHFMGVVNNVSDLGSTAVGFRRIHAATAFVGPSDVSGFSGTCAAATTLTVSGGIITGCS